MILLRVFTLWLSLCSVVAAQQSSGGFTVNPIRLELAPGAKATSLTINNDGSRARTVQVSAMRWTQVDGEDHYEPATDLIVNPPVFRIAAGGSQILRAGFRGGAPATLTESAYRLYLQEVPDVTESAPNQLRLLLRIGVPLFVQPVEETEGALNWAADRSPTGATRVSLSNSGNRRLRLSQLKATDAAGRQFDVAGLAYVLPGATRQWTLPQFAQAPIHVLARTDAGQVDVVLHAP
ncbi:MAG: fimbrial biogenesis chaperone [Panacagrimonas sp.]